MQSKLIVPLIVGAIAVGGGSFYGGMRYAAAQAGARQPQRASDFRAGRGGFVGGANAGRNPGGFTAGDIVSKDANSLTLKLRDGGSKIVFYASSTRISKMTDGSADDLAPGIGVMINGAANQDGSLTAGMIQVRPAGSEVKN